MMKGKIKILVILCFFVMTCIAGAFLLDKKTNLMLANKGGEEVDFNNDMISKKMETLLESNQLEGFLFQPGEKAICLYEGQYTSDLVSNKFAIYKETCEKNIIFVNMIFIENNTGAVYAWEGENLIQISKLEKEKLESIDISEYMNSQNLLLENINKDELMDNVMTVLEKNKYVNLKLLYDGTCDFVNRNYYVVSSFSDFEDHISRELIFYVDMEKGYVYIAVDNEDFLRTELHYIGSF